MTTATHTPVFNEDSLWREITSKWGAFGAHAEVYSMLLKDRDRLRGINKELVRALEALADAVDDDQADSLFELADARALIKKAKVKL